MPEHAVKAAYAADPSRVFRSPSDQWHYDLWNFQKGRASRTSHHRRSRRAASSPLRLTIKAVPPRCPRTAATTIPGWACRLRRVPRERARHPHAEGTTPSADVPSRARSPRSSRSRASRSTDRRGRVPRGSGCGLAATADGQPESERGLACAGRRARQGHRRDPRGVQGRRCRHRRAELPHRGPARGAGRPTSCSSAGPAADAAPSVRRPLRQRPPPLPPVRSCVARPWWCRPYRCRVDHHRAQTRSDPSDRGATGVERQHHRGRDHQGATTSKRGEARPPAWAVDIVSAAVRRSRPRPWRHLHGGDRRQPDAQAETVRSRWLENAPPTPTCAAPAPANRSSMESTSTTCNISLGEHALAPAGCRRRQRRPASNSGSASVKVDGERQRERFARLPVRDQGRDLADCVGPAGAWARSRGRRPSPAADVTTCPITRAWPSGAGEQVGGGPVGRTPEGRLDRCLAVDRHDAFRGDQKQARHSVTMPPRSSSANASSTSRRPPRRCRHPHR